MFQINNKQKEILKLLEEAYPNNLKKHILLEKMKSKPEEILSDVKSLEEGKLIETYYTYGDKFPAHMKITNYGKEKLHESIFTKLKESAYNNPWVVVAIILPLIVTIIFGVMNLSYQSQIYKLQQENYKQQQEIFELSKPYIVFWNLTVRSKSSNVDFPFNIRNPSNNEYVIDLSESTCNFETGIIHRYKPKEITGADSMIDTSSIGNQVIVNPSSFPKTSLLPNSTLQMRCNSSIDQARNETDTFINICIKIVSFEDKICEKIPLKILQPRVITINGTVE